MTCRILALVTPPLWTRALLACAVVLPLSALAPIAPISGACGT
jgi:hypothetical protein